MRRALTQVDEGVAYSVDVFDVHELNLQAKSLKERDFRTVAR